MLLAIRRLGGRAYPADVRREIASVTTTRVRPSLVRDGLDRLSAGGFLRWQHRRRRRKTRGQPPFCLYQLTFTGEQALGEYLRTLEALLEPAGRRRPPGAGVDPAEACAAVPPAP